MRRAQRCSFHAPAAARGESRAEAAAPHHFVPIQRLKLISVNIRKLLANLAEFKARLAI